MSIERVQRHDDLIEKLLLSILLLICMETWSNHSAIIIIIVIKSCLSDLLTNACVCDDAGGHLFFVLFLLCSVSFFQNSNFN